MARTIPTAQVVGMATKLAAGKATFTCTLTNSAETTCAIPFGDFAFGQIRNHSGGTLAITWHDADSATGTAGACEDEYGAAVTQSIATAKSQKFHEALAGCDWLLPVIASGSASVSVTLKR